VIAPNRAACDLQAVGTRDSEVPGWTVGRNHIARWRKIGSGTAEKAVAATRVWCALECLKKQGASNGAPLTIESRHADGWTVLRSGDDVIATLAMEAAPEGCALVLAVLASSTDASKFAERR
jgi:enediyne polyketide synthase